MATFDHKPQMDFLSFDGGVSARGALVKPSQSALRELSDIEERLLSGKKPRITCGAGLSFGAPHFGSGVTTIDNSRFSEIIGYEEESGLLEVQAGATMAHVFNYLVQKDRYLVTQPGYPSITIGGCIAVDVHGKNQLRDGNFREQVQSLKLYHPSRGVISASQTINKDVFELTCGGYGLTGHIISAKIRTRSLISPFMALYIVPVDDICDTPALIDKAARENDFVVSWHDFSARGAAFGRGFLLVGKFVADQKQVVSKPLPLDWPLNSQTRKGFDLACYSLPFNRLINVLYGSMNRQSNEVRLITVQECLYPARTLRQLYYKMFGKAGFHESQLIVPVDRFNEFTGAVKSWLDKNELAVTLASAKIFKGEQHLMQFDGDGVCFALNFPRCAASAKFLEFLDKLTIDLNLTPYLVKDSRLPLDVVKHSYKEYDIFKERLRAYDRDRLYRSELSQRLSL